MLPLPWMGVLLIQSSASAPARRTTRLDPTSEAKLAARIQDDACVSIVREIVSRFGPRMGGTPAGDQAAQWRKEWLRKAGLAVELVDDPDLQAYWTEPWTLAARAGGEVRPLEGAWPYLESASGAARVPLVGDAEQARGKALLAERARPGSEPAVWLVDGRASASGYPEIHRAPRGIRAPIFGIAKRDGEWLRAALAKGAVEIDFALKAHSRKAPPKTVIATLAGADSSRHVLFCAHGDSDSGGPGADDNASGEAVVMTIASAVAQAVASGEMRRPAVDLRFAIWGSEIHSTRAYVKRQEKAAGGLEAIVAVVNFDQAGYGKLFDAVYVEPDNRPANRELVECMLGVLRDFRGKTGFPERFTSNAALGGTDSYVFDGSMGTGSPDVAAVTVFSCAFGRAENPRRTEGSRGDAWPEKGDTVTVDFSDVYHSSGDTLANTVEREPYNIGRVARVALLGALRRCGVE
jgi:peptidase M28-like protein